MLFGIITNSWSNFIVSLDKMNFIIITFLS